MKPSLVTTPIFIIDCPFCKAKVAAAETGRADRSDIDEESGEPNAEVIHVGNCPRCRRILVGHTQQVDFEGIDAYQDRWSDVVRVYPKPLKTFSSLRIPRVVESSLSEADRSLQASANVAACVMFGRALEAVCHDILKPKDGAGTSAGAKQKPLTLAEGIKRLKDTNVIDDRLYDWSQQLRAFRNIGAHAVDITISHEDAGDLQAFVYAIIEYIYDLTDRYEDFKERAAKRAKKK
jgi:hypothetical protein